MKRAVWIAARSRWIAIIHDVLVIPFAWFSAYALRFNLDGIPPDALKTALKSFPTVFVLQVGAYWIVGLYRGIWQFASIPDLVRIIKAVAIGCGFSFLLLSLVMHFQGIPRSVLPIYGILLTFFLGGSRFAVRWFGEYRRYTIGERVLIVGAGRAGESLVRDLLRESDRKCNPIAFVDDCKSKQGQDIHGIRVAGECNAIPRFVEAYAIQLIIIAIPSATAEEMRRIMGYCEKTLCRVRTLPGLNDLVSGNVGVDLLREVSLEDLLGRAPVLLDWETLRTAIGGQTVLVTGGGGSIGSELSKQIASLKPKRLIVVERSEFNLFTLEQALLNRFPGLVLSRHLLDVCDKSAMNKILLRYQPQIIFHAAAYKHVPMLETQPREAILNNVLGTRIMAALAVEHRVGKFVFVSTDKAVNPANIMGASKRVSEMVCHYYSDQGITQFMTVRFGNVLGSAGSVVPIFRQQLESGGPITVTHPDITRFFMTIPEACQLILQASVIGKGGQILVLDMGEPIKIQFLAEQMIRLAGKKLGVDIQIQYTGLRPGEKLFEELFYPNEVLDSTTHHKIFQANARPFSKVWFSGMMDAMEQAVSQYDEERLRELLHQVVPELGNPSSIKVSEIEPHLIIRE